MRSGQKRILCRRQRCKGHAGEFDIQRIVSGLIATRGGTHQVDAKGEVTIARQHAVKAVTADLADVHGDVIETRWQYIEVCAEIGGLHRYRKFLAGARP